MTENVQAPTSPPHRLKPTDRADTMARLLAKDVGAALEQARRAAGISRADLARTLGVSGVTLLELEHGRGNPTLARHIDRCHTDVELRQFADRGIR